MPSPQGSDGLNIRLPLRSAHHEWLFAAGLALLLLLFAGVLAGEVQPADTGSGLQVQALPGVDGVRARLSDDGTALVFSGNGQREARVRLRMTLPIADTDADGGRWVIWVGRNPVDGIELRRGDWRSGKRSFFDPDASEGVLPPAYVFPLPIAWRGDISVDLEASSNVQSVLRPRLMRADAASRLARQGIAISAMLYASLFTLALLALALFSAARDRMFLAFFGYATINLLMLAAVNGHLYQVHGLGWLAGWGALGLLALGFVHAAASLQMLLHYTAGRAARAQFARVVDGFCLMLALFAAVCLLDQPMLQFAMQLIGVVCWIAGAVFSLVLLVDAAHRRVPMAWPLAALSLLGTLATLLLMTVLKGEQVDLAWVRYGYQIAWVAFATVLAVGLISRISEYRDQRDREQLARADSERRMRREAARSDLNAALQTKLRTCAESDVEWTAFHLLLDHLMPQLDVIDASIIAQGYHGQDVFMAIPQARKQQAEAAIRKRLLLLKRQAGNGIPLQQPMAVAGTPAQVAMEAMVPLQIRAPAWGMLLFERAGGEGFTTEELALAGECTRLTLTHIDQALAAITLRRSAELDAMTGTFNRRTIDQWLVRSFAEAERDHHPLSVLFVDMDHFKAINDKYGHPCGDHCLRKVAAKLREALGEGDLLGRYGGEEFIGVLPGRGGAAARVIAEQMRRGVERLEIEWEGHMFHLSVSVGVATRPDGAIDPFDTIDRADKALYAAKRNGRNCVHVAPAVFS